MLWNRNIYLYVCQPLELLKGFHAEANHMSHEPDIIIQTYACVLLWSRTGAFQQSGTVFICAYLAWEGNLKLFMIEIRLGNIPAWRLWSFKISINDFFRSQVATLETEKHTPSVAPELHTANSDRPALQSANCDNSVKPFSRFRRLLSRGCKKEEEEEGDGEKGSWCCWRAHSLYVYQHAAEKTCSTCNMQHLSSMQTQKASFYIWKKTCLKA